jgi:hypothetical protein
MDQPTIHHGASEFIKDLRGKEHEVRHWTGQRYQYTRLGRTYFDANKAKYIVSLPVLIEGRRGAGRDHSRDGEFYERRAMMPVSQFGVGEILLSDVLTDSQKQIRVQKLVLDGLGANAGDAEILLHQESNERWLLDPGPESYKSYGVSKTGGSITGGFR